MLGPGAGGVRPERGAPAGVLPLVVMFVLMLMLVLVLVGRLPAMALKRRSSCCRADRMRSKASTRKL